MTEENKRPTDYEAIERLQRASDYIFRTRILATSEIGGNASAEGWEAMTILLSCRNRIQKEVWGQPAIPTGIALSAKPRDFQVEVVDDGTDGVQGRVSPRPLPR